MADKKEDKAPKADKADKAAEGRTRPRRRAGRRRPKARQGAKADARREADGASAPEPKRSRRGCSTHFDEVVRKKLDRAVRLQEPDAGAGASTRSCSTWASARASTTARRSSRPPPISALIAGQKAVITKARKSIATFKLREARPIGCKVTLRKARMYEFLDRLVNIALPRVRDFRGLNPKSFDGRGNYTLGIKEHIIFPEIDYDKVDRYLGHGHHVCTTREDRRRGARAADGIQLPVPAVRARASNAESQET